MFQVDVSARDLSPFVELVGEARVEAVARRAQATRVMLGSHAIWNVNSTAAGGGVAEILRSLLRYARGLGVDVRWAVLDGTPEFFAVTKRLHNALHDDAGDGSALGPAEREVYERVTRANAAELVGLARRGDIVICHDPQTAGLVPELVRAGLRVVWRCHIGHDREGAEVDAGWEFLRRYVEEAMVAVFSRESYAPRWVPRARVVVLPPNIDPFSVKNHWMSERAVAAILGRAGLVDVAAEPSAATFVREDGRTSTALRTARVVRAARPPAWDAPLVVQISRWDRMKDHAGLLEAFRRLVAPGDLRDAEIVLAGPAVGGVADDPEGPEVFADVERAWRALPDPVRRRAHLAQIPMDDVDENAAIVNALQRHAAVIVQKSLREGFGLTVTEAMWKRRPTVASAVGGIQDQIRDGVDGLLIRDPRDPHETAAVLRRVLSDPALAARLGDAAYEHVRAEYLSVSALERWAELVGLLYGKEIRAA